ncbi:MAG: amidohydrolase family protein [Pseudomonadota bacterium]
MTLTRITGARIFDGVSDEILEDADVLIEGEQIREVGPGLTSGETVIAAEGRFLMPGLIDAHFHANTPGYDFYATDRMPPALLAAHATRLLEGALDRGYTTLRDAGGGTQGLALALEAGLIDGPRFFYPGKAITQTGGHGDMRRKGWIEPCGCAYSGVVCQSVDGEDEMRRAARETFRQGAHQLKLFLSGGVSTDLAPLAMPHFSDAEIGVAVEEAARRGSYVMAHCHTDEGSLRGVRLGIRSIEHGSLIGADTAAEIAATGAYVVPTLSAGELIGEHAAELGLPPSAAEKIHEVNARALEAVTTCAAAGVKLGLGCDLHGNQFLQTQGREIALRARAQPVIDVLRSATSINAEIVQRPGELGVIAPGALADLILIDGDPVADPAILTHSAKTVALVMLGGTVRRRRM